MKVKTFVDGQPALYNHAGLPFANMKRKESIRGGRTVMKDVVKVLKPTLLTAIILLPMLLTQVVICSSTTYSVTGTAAKKSTSSPASATDSNSSRAKSVTKPRSDIIRGKTRPSYGMGAPIRVTHNGARTVDINWFILSMNLVFCYLFASLVSLMLTEATRCRRPALVYGSVTVVMIATAFCAAIGMSKWHWGYFLSRPAVLKEINEVPAVSAVIPVQTESDEAGNRKIVGQEDYLLADCLAHGREPRTTV